MRTTTLSTKSHRFIRSSLNCYVLAGTDYSLLRKGSSYYLRKGSKVVKWDNNKFFSVTAATNFINSHELEDATEDNVPYSPDDVAYLIEAYNFQRKGPGIFFANIGTVEFSLKIDKYGFLLTVSEDGKESVHQFDNYSIGDLMLLLDRYYPDSDYFTDAAILEATHILAANDANRSSRELASNLVRVKSSNIWSYGINLKDRKNKTGDVYVQFKGNKGGPGDVYVYYDVPVIIWRKWLSASSKGHYFWKFIRNQFMYSKLTGDRRGKLRNAVN